jgi:serine/threonine-protein kinase
MHRMDPLLGRTLASTYRVVRLLGQGGMGAVYEAVHEPLGRRVALKVLAAHFANHPTAIPRLQREALAAARLGHPNIVTVTDFRSAAGEPPFLVMEYLDGASVERLLGDAERLAPQRAVFIALQALDALGAAHRAGIVHRDIKPANLMVLPLQSGELVKVLDFGVAKLWGSDAITQSGAIVGSPLFMAPEQAFSDEVDGRADLYSIGATLYRALSGVVPLEADSLPRLLTRLRDDTPRPLGTLCPQLDPSLSAAVDRALLKPPQARYQSAEEMIHALRRFALGPSVSTPVHGTTGHSLGGAGARNPSGPPLDSPAPMLPLPQLPAITASASQPRPQPQPASSFAPNPSVAPTPPRARLPWIVAGALLATALVGAAGAGASYLWLGRTPPEAPPAAGAPSRGSVAAGPSASGAVPGAASEPLAPSASPALASVSASGKPRGATAPPSAVPSATVPPAVPSASSSASTLPSASTSPLPAPTVAPSGGPFIKECRASMYPAYKSADSGKLQDALAGRRASLQACAPLACFRHDKSRDVGYYFPSFSVSHDAKGAVTGVSRLGDGCAPLDACVIPIVRGWRLPPPEKAGDMTLSLGFREAPTTD